ADRPDGDRGLCAARLLHLRARVRGDDPHRPGPIRRLGPSVRDPRVRGEDREAPRPLIRPDFGGTGPRSGNTRHPRQRSEESRMNDKTAFVTGATGCVGRNLVDALIADGGWRIIAAHRASSKISRLRGLPIELKQVDLHDLDSVMASIPEGVDAVFHVAASISHWLPQEAEQWKDNVLATRNLAQAALRRKAKRFVFTSTGATYKYADTTRDEAQHIDMSYVRTKRLAEIEVMDAVSEGLDAVIMRPIIIVGRYDNHAYSQIFTTM